MFTFAMLCILFQANLTCGVPYEYKPHDTHMQCNETMFLDFSKIMRCKLENAYMHVNIENMAQLERRKNALESFLRKMNLL